MKIRPIAFHLPQFHPIPENNEWWGNGFTEWTNVTKAKPLFQGHYQPHLPADLGFYDLRLAETRIAQAELARQYGLYGFCYYHYWFNGKRLLNRPLDDMITSRTPDFPFMLCWANENWTRRWDGLEQEVLISQTYSHEDDLRHIQFLCKKFFSDARYIRVNGKPFLLIYRPALFPDIKRTLSIYREEALKQGIGELYLGYVQHFSFKKDPAEYGFDCAIEFQPDFDKLPIKSASFAARVKNKLGIQASPFIENTIVSYPEFVDRMIAKPKNEKTTFPGITPGWDNSARRQKGATIFIDSDPVHYERWLKSIKEKYKGEETFLFINAWNEWAEGSHLEPCQKWGKHYLEITAKTLNELL
ncbi:MAG: glycosyl hydrolase [Segetibacter sp.]|nr:glycosyl hydrolase [Segetibacter sp.]